MTAVLSTVSTIESGATITTQLLGVAALAVVPAALAALGYRAAAEQRIPAWLAVTAGVAVAALYLGTTPALEVLLEETDPAPLAAALFDVSAVVLSAGGGALGRVAGDRFGTEVLTWSPTHEAGDDVSQLAQAVGQVTTVSLPETIEDAPGYDPVPERTKDDLAGSEFVFPRDLTVAELEERITEQLRSDYGIGVADVQFDEYGDVTALAVGTRAAGIGATLPPATNAVAVRADPGFSASTGDIVQVWEPESTRRVCTGELRGVAGDAVTIAIDAGDTPKLDPTRRYQLVTLPVEDRPDREFAALLRAAEETFSTATVEAGSPLHGQPVGALDLTVTAIRPESGDPVPFPQSEYRLAPGDLLFVIATPADLRRLESAATALDPALASPEPPAGEAEPAEGIQTAEPTATAREEPTGPDGLPATDDQPTAQSAEDTGSDPDTGTAAANGDAAFDQLNADLESGEADPPADAATEDVEVAFSDDEEDTLTSLDEAEISFADDADDTGEDDEDELVGLDEAEISFADDEDGDAELGGLDIDEDLQGESADDVSDDIGDLEFEDQSEDVSDLDLSDDEGPFDVDDDSETGTGQADDDEDAGGGTSFAQLKEEFESGDADWEDDVSDSPGGDMRLDE